MKVPEAFRPHVQAADNGLVVSLTTGQGQRSIPILGFSLISKRATVSDTHYPLMHLFAAAHVQRFAGNVPGVIACEPGNRGSRILL